MSASHGVRAADGHRERVDAGVAGEAGRLVGPGAHPGGVHAVLAADLPQLGLDADAGGVAALDHGPGDCAVLGVVELRPVEHHRGEAQPEGLVDQGRADGVVEVQHHGHGGPLGEHPGGGRDRSQGAVERHGVLTDLQHDGQPDLLGGPGQRLGVLEVDDVEGRHAAALRAGVLQHVMERDEHGGPPGLVERGLRGAMGSPARGEAAD
jgi:hypothetical protein